MKNLQSYSNLIKQEAKRLGFESCGISKAGFLDEEASNLESWLNNGFHGEMKYMENYFDKRLDPRLLVDDAKSVISLSYNYFHLFYLVHFLLFSVLPHQLQPPHQSALSRESYRRCD